MSAQRKTTKKQVHPEGKQWESVSESATRFSKMVVATAGGKFDVIQ